VNPSYGQNAVGESTSSQADGAGKDGERKSPTPFAGGRKVRIKYLSKRRANGRSARGGNGDSKSGKHRRHNSLTEPGELILDTPFVKRHLGPKSDGNTDSKTANGPSLSLAMTQEIDESADPRPTKRRKLDNSPAASAEQLDKLGKEEARHDKELTTRLTKDLETLLRQTQPKVTMRKGANSLLSMCSRKQVEVTREDQTYVDTLPTEERYDVISELYHYLQEKYAALDRGWRPLRELVRSHGVELLCDAYKKKLFGPAVLQELIRTAHSAIPGPTCDVWTVPESRTLLSCAIVKPTEPIPPSDYLLGGRYYYAHESKIFQCRRMIGYGTVHLSSIELNDLLSTGLLSLDGIASADVTNVLKKAVEQIARYDQYNRNDAAVVQTTILHALGIGSFSIEESIHQLRMIGAIFGISGHKLEPTTSYSSSALSPAVQNTILSLTNILLAIELLRSSKHASASKPPPEFLFIPALSLKIQQYRNLRRFPQFYSLPPLRALEASHILLGHYLLLRAQPDPILEIQVNTSPEVILEIFTEILDSVSANDIEDLQRALTSSICSLARFCGRAYHNQEFGYFKKFVSLMTITPTNEDLVRGGENESSTLAPYPSASSFLQTVAIEAAMAFAEQGGWKEHFDFAESLSMSLDSCKPITQDLDPLPHLVPPNAPAVVPAITLTHQSFIPRFRWESAIGEWIAKTPAKSLSQPFCCQLLPEMSDPDSDTPSDELGKISTEVSHKLVGALDDVHAAIKRYGKERKDVRDGKRHGSFNGEFRNQHRRVRDKNAKAAKGNESTLNTTNEVAVAVVIPAKTRPGAVIIPAEKRLRAHWEPQPRSDGGNDEEQDELSIDYVSPLPRTPTLIKGQLGTANLPVSSSPMPPSSSPTPAPTQGSATQLPDLDPEPETPITSVEAEEKIKALGEITILLEKTRKWGGRGQEKGEQGNIGNKKALRFGIRGHKLTDREKQLLEGAVSSSSSESSDNGGEVEDDKAKTMTREQRRETRKLARRFAVEADEEIVGSSGSEDELAS
jgi:hypothetical protein